MEACYEDSEYPDNGKVLGVEKKVEFFGGAEEEKLLDSWTAEGKVEKVVVALEKKR